MDGTLITWLANNLGDSLIYLHTAGIAYIIWRQHAHEKHCRERHKTHYDSADDLRQRVARLEG